MPVTRDPSQNNIRRQQLVHYASFTSMANFAKNSNSDLNQLTSDRN